MLSSRQARGDSNVAYTAHVGSSSDDDSDGGGGGGGGLGGRAAATPGAAVVRGGVKGGQATIPGTIFNLVNNIVRACVAVRV